MELRRKAEEEIHKNDIFLSKVSLPVLLSVYYK